MSDKRIGSTENKLMLRLDVDATAPVPTEVNARPHSASQAERLENGANDKCNEAIREGSPSQETDSEGGENQQGGCSRKQGEMGQARCCRLRLDGWLCTARGGHPVGRPQQPGAHNYPVCVSHRHNFQH